MPDTLPLLEEDISKKEEDNEIVIKYRNKLKIEKETLKQRLEVQKIVHKSVPQTVSEETSKKGVGTIFYNGASLESMSKVIHKEISIPSK
jgi:hypothetical protein